MSDSDLSSNSADNGNDKDQHSAGDDGRSPRLGDRFRAPASSGEELREYDPGAGDEKVDKVAKRFRSGPRLGSPELDEQQSLDERDGGAEEDVDEGSVLDALDQTPEDAGGGPSPGQMPGSEPAATQDDLPVVDIEPIDGEADDEAVDERELVCPSCHAENPEGMRFCVECGGSLDAPDSSKGASELKGEVTTSEPDPVDVDRDPPPPSKAAEEKNPWDMQIVCINEDGSDGKSIPLEYLETTVGREADDRFPTDAFLSPKHARLHIEDGNLFIEDLYSLNGTFIKLRDEKRLAPGDTILMGRQVLRFERFDQSITPKTRSSDGTRYMGSPAPGGNFKVLQIGIGGVVQNVYCLPEAGAVLGREKGDIVFPHDKFMSGRHAQIYPDDDGHCYLVDLNSSNGTWIKIWEKTKLDDDDHVFMGQQLFRIQYD